MFILTLVLFKFQLLPGQGCPHCWKSSKLEMLLKSMHDDPSIATGMGKVHAVRSVYVYTMVYQGSLLYANGHH